MMLTTEIIQAIIEEKGSQWGCDGCDEIYFDSEGDQSGVGRSFDVMVCGEKDDEFFYCLKCMIEHDKAMERMLSAPHQ